MPRAAKIVWSAAAIAVAVLIAASPASAGKGCAARRMTIVGPFCMDRYEASVWRIPSSATALIRKAQTGKPTAAELIAGGATQLGVGDEEDYDCAGDASNCADIYAASTAGVRPSANLTWFQAQRACVNAGKRLPRNDEWQAAANGTPDPGGDDGTTDCNVDSAGQSVAAGSRSACVSRFGNFDMVGNVHEWVDGWIPVSTNCPGWGDASLDVMCLSGASTLATSPGDLARGGSWVDSVGAGPLSVVGLGRLVDKFSNFGFRCAR